MGILYQGGALVSVSSLGNLGITADATELNYVDGVTSNIQTQISDLTSTVKNGYLPIAGGTITGTTAATSTSTGALVVKGGLGVAGSIYADTVYGAVYNDYAEYRSVEGIVEPGRVVIEMGDDTLTVSTERLQAGANVISDTFGFAIGETNDCKTPVAVSGRVLVYTYEDRDSYAPGDAVCAAPNGTVSKMTREEVMTYPERIVGTVSSVPNYETWGTNNVAVNGRIWVKIR